MAEERKSRTGIIAAGLALLLILFAAVWAKARAAIKAGAGPGAGGIPGVPGAGAGAGAGAIELMLPAPYAQLVPYMRYETWTGTPTGGFLRVISRRVPADAYWVVFALDGAHRGSNLNGFTLAAFIVPPDIAQQAAPGGGPADDVELEANQNIAGAMTGPRDGVLINFHRNTYANIPAQGGRVNTYMDNRDVIVIPPNHAILAMLVESAAVVGDNAGRLRAIFAEVPLSVAGASAAQQTGRFTGGLARWISSLRR